MIWLKVIKFFVVLALALPGLFLLVYLPVSLIEEQNPATYYLAAVFYPILVAVWLIKKALRSKRAIG